jgi:hypothetical protein
MVEAGDGPFYWVTTMLTIGIVVNRLFAAGAQDTECGDYRHTKAHQLRGKLGNSPYCSVRRSRSPRCGLRPHSYKPTKSERCARAIEDTNHRHRWLLRARRSAAAAPPTRE